jgi:hypothetical protein
VKQASLAKYVAATLPEKVVYDQNHGSGVPAENWELYRERYASLLSDAYLKEMLSQEGSCTPPGPAKNERCIILATSDGGIWHSVTAAEKFESTWSSERIIGRFADPAKVRADRSLDQNTSKAYRQTVDPSPGGVFEGSAEKRCRGQNWGRPRSLLIYAREFRCQNSGRPDFFG